MGRIRSIKPEFPQSESMGRVSREARLCFVLLWTMADDEGRLRGNAALLASLLYPYDAAEAARHMPKWIGELEREGCVTPYKVGADSYVQITNWRSHQKIDKPSPSKLPPPPDTASRILANGSEPSRALAVGEEWKGEDQEGRGAGVARARRVWAVYLETRATVFADRGKTPTGEPQATKSRLDAIERYCNEYGEDLVTDAAKGFRFSPWHSGVKDGALRVAPENVFHVTSKINQVELLADLARRAAAGERMIVSVGQPQSADFDRLQAGGKVETLAPPISIPSRLQRLADSLPPGLPTRAALASAIVALSGDPEEVEAKLRDLNRQMLCALRDEMSAETRATLDADSRAAWARVRGRAGADESTFRDRVELLAVRERFSAPVLSLFSDAAGRMAA